MSTTPGAASPKIQTLGWINLFANAADQIATVALPIVYVSKLAGDAGDTSILTMAATLPLLLFSLPFGALADRVQARSLLLVGEGIRLASLIGLIVLLAMPDPSFALIALLAIGGGTGTVAFQVAAPTLVAKSTTGILRQQLNSNIELARSIAITAGPPLAGVLVSVAGGSIALSVGAALVLIALLAAIRLPVIAESPAAKRRVRGDFSEGIRFTLKNPWLRPILFVSMFFNLGWYVLLGVIVAWASSELGMSSIGIGAMFACYGVGMIAGASFMKRTGTSIKETMLVQIGPWCGFTFAALIALTMVIRDPWILFVAFFLIGTGPIIWTITTITIRQTVTPSSLLGRVSAAIMFASAGGRPIGAGIGYLGFKFGGYPLVFAIALALFGTQAFLIGCTALASEQAPATQESAT